MFFKHMTTLIAKVMVLQTKRESTACVNKIHGAAYPEQLQVFFVTHWSLIFALHIFLALLQE